MARKPAKRRAPAASSVSPLDTDGLTTEYRRSVAATIPGNIDVPEAFWRDLEAAIRAFVELQQRRLKRPPQEERKRWRRIAELAEELGAELREVRRGRRIESDLAWPSSGLSALWWIKDRADAYTLAYQMLGAAFSGRKNPHRWSLYGRLCWLWVSHLGQPLRYSRSLKGPPTGPFIQFFDACTRPVLGADALSSYAIARIVDSER